MTVDKKKSCYGCVFALLKEHGYSNWTVEGADFHCLKSLHPEDGFDAFYGEAKELAFGEDCSGFVKGNPLAMDVEEETETEMSESEPFDKLYFDWKRAQ